MTSEDELIFMENISKAFSGVTVLEGVTLSLKRGSVHALVGENGAGKSTLMKILTGMYADYGGTIYWEGKEIRFANEKEALSAGISIVAQELTPVPELTIAENIFLGREPAGRLPGMVDRKKLFSQTAELMKRLGLDYDPRTKMKMLSVAETQMVEIIKAISRDSKLIVMDEPTSALTDSETHYLFEQIEALRAEGIAIVFISHKFDEIFRICDEVSVLRDGKFIATKPIGELTEEEIVAMMVGRSIADIYPPLAPPSGNVAFEAKGISRKGVLSDISFCVNGGEILGIAGMMGAGRTEVVRTIFGLDSIDAGEFYLGKRPIAVRSAGQAIGHGIVMVTEDRKNLGIVPVRPIIDNIALPNMDLYSRWGILSRQKLRSEAESMCRSLAVKAHSLDMEVGQLSGGNQQKVVLAKWLLRDIKLLILDEPTRGIDIGAKHEIYKLMRDLAKQGIPIIMISSELPEVLGMCHRVLVMAEGRIQGELSRQEASQEKIMEMIVGAKQPPNRLEQEGNRA
ncbi:sugar ABC transporter ATP-binding protein [Paenibacillaceae bacterium WGS1546]|uniref:sugar ABC transporter ATP-binding protein n=1 Tax=Cohnella sp. WGS1546 TaxID=3366810 RepID=UPI00372D75F2